MLLVQIIIPRAIQNQNLSRPVVQNRLNQEENKNEKLYLAMSPRARYSSEVVLNPRS